MPLKILKKPGFYYVAYNRKEIENFVEFRTMLETLSKPDTRDRDIIVDLTKGTLITDGEFAVLANVVKRFRDTKRTLRIVASDGTKARFDATNLFKAGNVEIHFHHISLFESLNRSHKILSPEQQFAESIGQIERQVHFEPVVCGTSAIVVRCMPV